MISVNIRKQGGAAVMTIPSDVLRVLNLHVGSQVMLDVTKGDLVVRPVRVQQKRYSLQELLHGITSKVIKEMRNETVWAREGDSIGREII